MAFLHDTSRQEVDVNGDPLSGAKLYFYQTGTTTEITTYQDAALTTPHASPVVADASGRFAPIYLNTSPYKTSLYTSADVLVQTVDPVYGTSAPSEILPTALGLHDICQGRLTLTSGTPVTTSNVTAAATLYFARHDGNKVAVYDGSSQWYMVTLTELSIALSGGTASKPHDVFLDYNAGSPQLVLVAWTNDTTRATALTKQDNIYVLTGATDHRYLGTIYLDGSKQCEDSLTHRHVWNMHNRVYRAMQVMTASSWTYTTEAWRQARGGTGSYELDFVRGLNIDAIEAEYHCAAVNTSVVTCRAGLGETTSSPLVGSVAYTPTPDTNPRQMSALWRGLLDAGRKVIYALENSSAAGTTTWYGADASFTGRVAGGLFA